MGLVVREADGDDWPWAHELCYATVGVAKLRARDEYLQMLEAEVGSAVAVVPRLGANPVGLATAALLHPAFSAELAQAKHPYVHVHIRRRRVLGEPVFLSHRHLGRANARSGAVLLIGHFGLGRTGGDEARSIARTLFEGLVDHTAGDRIASLWVEAVGSENIASLVEAGYQPLPRYGEGDPSARAKPRPFALLEMTRERAQQVGDRNALRLLSYQPPVLGIPPALQQYAELVLRGHERGEVAAHLGVSVAAVDRRRARLIEHVRRQVPELSLNHSADGRLGPILNLLRERPSELRPYDP